MTNKSAVLAVLVTLSLPANAAVHELQSGETRWSGKIQPGATLQVKGGVGDIAVVTAPDDSFTVEVTRGSEGTVVPRIVIAETATAVAVCTDYIAKAGAPSKCSPGPGRVRSAWSTKGYARADLKITDDDYIGLLGPAKGPLLRLELYINQGPTRLIEIVAE